MLTLFNYCRSLVGLLLVPKEIEQISLRELVRDFDFHPTERFLVYGFCDFLNQIKTLNYPYYILSSDPYSIILVELDEIQRSVWQAPTDLKFKKYYDV